MQQVDLDVAKSAMVAAGIKTKMGSLSLLVWLVSYDLFRYNLQHLVFGQVKTIFGVSCQQDSADGKCTCPPGFKGDGVKSCAGKRP